VFYFCSVYTVDRSKYFSSDAPYYGNTCCPNILVHAISITWLYSCGSGWPGAWVDIGLVDIATSGHKVVNNLSQVESCELVPSSCEVLYLCGVYIVSVHPAFQN
jgi:hypothetical protein